MALRFYPPYLFFYRFIYFRVWTDGNVKEDIHVMVLLIRA